jgi:cellulose synthase/poly-beta-1,6-N-acetylglucosamine synthase-like glycosyltransferase/sugar lactone lactonase YvrE
VTHVRVSGKFLSIAGDRFLVKGVAYGTFAPDGGGVQFPDRARIAQDFALMAEAGINTVRAYTPPPIHLLDEAARHGLRVMVGLPWSQHIAFLRDGDLARRIRRETAEHVRTLGAHPAALLFAIGNEIPPSVVRWHGARRIEEFLRAIYDAAKSASPESLLTYVNYPPTEYLNTECFDVAAFNVYLHRETELRAYLARLQQIAGNRPLMLAEAGADSIREGADGQAQITAMHLRAAFAEGLCGAVAFSWTDEWWRGGHEVTDWAFGLVDRDRRPKPALAAVKQAFAEAPFSPDVQRGWPRVSVAVCAYNAADTLDDCLSSLRRLDYPDYEVLVIDDGSRDATGAIADRYAAECQPGANGQIRVIHVANGGLSAARNIGVREATGAIVAYTDADVRVEPDWLTYLVQPFLTSTVVGSGGPNVIPADDPWVAQCVARSPGGPTHVLLDDRVAEHVPGCNMAFRRDALLGIDGFNPVYLRAGDDVDVCWRLQAKGQKIGFAPSALVWHHHRASVKAYWRQQVGYGEGETWLDAHHPEKFVRGNMLWRGRIYSPLPFVRSLSGQRINYGVWGTSAFPSVYRTDVHGFQFLPHLPAWWFTSTAFLILGAFAYAAGFRGLSATLLGLGVLGWLTTTGRCLVFAWRSDLSDVPTARTWASRQRHRLLIAWMHFIQPFARFYGRVRGMLNPPPVVEPERVTRFPWKAPLPKLRDAVSTTALLLGTSTDESFWGERWTSHDAVLSEVAGLLRAARPARSVDIDDGWRADRDVSIAVGRWGWLDLRVLLEEHGGPKVLLRAATKLRPTLKGIALAATMAGGAVLATSAAIAFKWPLVSFATAAFVAIVFGDAAWATARAVAVMRRAVERAADVADMVRVPVKPHSLSTRRFSLRPVAMSQVVQTIVALALTGSAVLTGTSVVSDLMARARQRPVVLSATRLAPTFDAAGALAVAPNGELYWADGRNGVIKPLDYRLYEQPVGTSGKRALPSRQAPPALQFASVTDVAVASSGDLYVADAQNDRICRIDRANGKIITVAGSGVAGFDGDMKQATQSALNAPNAVAVARNGDLYIADTANNRVRVVVQATGVIRTVAGDGIGGSGALIGDGGPATHAHLDHPTDVAIAPDGDLYIADMGHNRIRMVDAQSGIITTVAGDGLEAMRGDGGLAVAASLSGPSGVALEPIGRHVIIYIADYYNNRVRRVGLDGRISTVPGLELERPTRLAMRPGGWLYVASGGKVNAVNVNKEPVQLASRSQRANPLVALAKKVT